MNAQKERVMLLNHDELNANHGVCLGLLRVILATNRLDKDVIKEAGRVVEEMEAHHKATRTELERALEKAEYLEQR